MGKDEKKYFLFEKKKCAPKKSRPSVKRDKKKAEKVRKNKSVFFLRLHGKKKWLPFVSENRKNGALST